MCWYLTLVLNMFVFTSYTGEINNHEQRIDRVKLFNTINEESSEKLIKTFGIAMVVFSCIVVIFFLFKKFPPIISQARSASEKFNFLQGGIIGTLFTFFFRLIFIIFNLFLRVEVVYFLAYALFAVMGTFYHPFFFVFHMTYLFFREKRLAKVFKSIWLPRMQIIYTLVLMILLLYVFTAVAFM